VHHQKLELRLKILESKWFPAFEGTRSITKMHKTSIHVSLKEIRGETDSHSRNHTKNKGTKNSTKTTRITMLNLLYIPGMIYMV
jgi:hypothetical protein